MNQHKVQHLHKITPRLLLNQTELWIVISSSIVGGLALIGILAYLYYRYLKKNDQGTIVEL